MSNFDRSTSARPSDCNASLQSHATLGVNRADARGARLAGDPTRVETTSTYIDTTMGSSMEYGVYGRVLFCGHLEKRRDGAVRGGWATRLFLLTPNALHYFRKVTDHELLGEERGTLPLSMIKGVRAMPEDEVPPSVAELGGEHYYLEIATETRSFLMRTPVAEASTCESWSIAIEEQRKAVRADQQSMDHERMCSSLLAAAAVDALPSPTLLASTHERFTRFEAAPPRVAMVSVVRVSERDAKPVEVVVKRHVAYGDALDLGVVPQGGACVILLQDGGLGRIGTQALMGSWDAGQACWIEVVDADAPTEIEVSVACTVVSQATQRPVLTSANVSPKLPKWVEYADEGASVGFLLMCLFVHLLYGVDGFHWSHKCCLTVGAALAISTILNGPARNPPVQILTPKHSNTSMLPKLQFRLTVHRCRIKTDSSANEFLYYPSDGRLQLPAH